MPFVSDGVCSRSLTSGRASRRLDCHVRVGPNTKATRQLGYRIAIHNIVDGYDIWEGGGGGVLILAYRSHLTIDHASLSRGAPFLLLIDTSKQLGAQYVFFHI